MHLCLWSQHSDYGDRTTIRATQWVQYQPGINQTLSKNKQVGEQAIRHLYCTEHPQLFLILVLERYSHSPSDTTALKSLHLIYPSALSYTEFSFPIISWIFVFSDLRQCDGLTQWTSQTCIQCFVLSNTIFPREIVSWKNGAAPCWWNELCEMNFPHMTCGLNTWHPICLLWWHTLDVQSQNMSLVREKPSRNLTPCLTPNNAYWPPYSWFILFFPD